MRVEFSIFLMALVSSGSCLELKIELDSDTVVLPQWVSGTIKVKNNESRTRIISMEESQPEIFLSRDTAVKLAKAINFGPESPVSLEPGVSAMWCFMADIPRKYALPKPKGFRKISLTVRQFGAEAKSSPFTLQIPGPLSDKELWLATMENIVRQLDNEERIALDDAAKRIAFSGKIQGNVDPRIVFWKYRLRHAAFMKDLRQMPVCENCFRMPATLYWTHLLSEWCGMFYWKTPRCAENEARLHTMLVSRLGALVEAPNEMGENPVVRTENGKFLVGKWQAKILKSGGLRK